MERLVEWDYPQNWPNIVPEAILKLKSAQKTEDLYGALYVIKTIVTIH